MFIYFVAFEVTRAGRRARSPRSSRARARRRPEADVEQSAIRNAFTLLPIIPFIGGLLGFIAIIVIAVTINGSPTKQGKHDELAGGTQVVKG